MIYTITAVLGVLFLFLGDLSASDGETVEDVFKVLKWYGHASFGLETEKIIYIDPWNIPKTAPKADLILVTHSHFDHLSFKDIERLQKEETKIVCPEVCVSLLSGQVKGIRSGQEIEIDGVKVKAFPAYNPSKSFHPKRNEWVGYIITVKEVKLYHAGDTDLIPEMKKLKGINITLLPVGGKYTMSAEEAAQAASIIKADISIPMHYGGDVIGSMKDALKFKELCQGEVRILKKNEN
ncbi:MAG: MBL fold metallo-hydrolase [Candidatus Aminicenantes bacterium]|nr:MBL fold metallo-hydrolase [Candidatus Aminicenantes bacterium]